MIQQYISIRQGGGGSVSVAVSDASPNFGVVITITATATGFTPTNYLFYAQQGGQLLQIGEQSGNVINWTVSIIGTFKIFVNATDSPIGAFNAGGLDVTSNAVVVTTNIQLWQDPFRSNVVPPTYPDISGFGRDGTMVNSPTFVAGTLFPNGGGYTEFNGVDQSIGSIGTVSDFAFIQNTLQFTIGAWIRVTDLTGRNQIVGNTATSTERGFLFHFETVDYGLGGPRNLTKRLTLALQRGVSGVNNILFILSQDNVITAVGWNYAVITMNGLNTGQFYLNGQSITTSELGTYALPTGNSTRTLSVGRPTGFNVFYTGRIGPLQIYDRALTASEILQNFETDRYRYGI